MIYKKNSPAFWGWQQFKDKIEPLNNGRFWKPVLLTVTPHAVKQKPHSRHQKKTPCQRPFQGPRLQRVLECSVMKIRSSTGVQRNGAIYYRKNPRTAFQSPVDHHRSNAWSRNQQRSHARFGDHPRARHHLARSTSPYEPDHIHELVG